MWSFFQGFSPIRRLIRAPGESPMTFRWFHQTQASPSQGWIENLARCAGEASHCLTSALHRPSRYGSTTREKVISASISCVPGDECPLNGDQRPRIGQNLDLLDAISCKSPSNSSGEVPPHDGHRSIRSRVIVSRHPGRWGVSRLLLGPRRPDPYIFE